jgi:hypothetical protein
MGFNNKYNQFRDIKSFTEFNRSGKDSPDYVVTMNYFYKVLDKIHDDLLNNKNMTKEQADDFIDKFIAIDANRIKQMRDIVNTYFIEKKEPSVCAEDLLKKFYKITVINNNTDTISDEMTEVSEKKFYHFKMASTSLFWRFFNILLKNNIRFNLNNTYVVNSTNSFNDDNFNFIMKTKDVTKNEIEIPFRNNSIFNEINKVVKNTDDEIKFYIGINNDSLLDFGYIYGENEYSIGKCKYNNYDIIKIINNSNNIYHNLAYFDFIVKFKSIIKILNYYKKILIKYFSQYPDIEIYIGIEDENLNIIIESELQDVINVNYLNTLLNDNRYTKIKRDWSITEKNKNDKVYYYITI